MAVLSFDRDTATGRYLRAAALMLLATVFFSIMVGGIRHVSAEVNSFLVVFFRNLFGLIIIGPVIARLGFSFLRTSNYRLLILRTLCGLASMFLWFYAVTLAPLAEAVALSFTAPLFVTFIAFALLGERRSSARWVATLVGFGGALLVVRPGFAEISYAHIMLLVSSVLNAASIILIKQMTRTDPAERIVAYMVLLFAPGSLIPALFVWDWPGWNALFWLAVIGASGTFAHILQTRSLAAADATAVMPYDFARLPFAALIGFIAFHEVPDLWTVLGAIVIFGASFYVGRDETRRNRVPPPAAPH